MNNISVKGLREQTPGGSRSWLPPIIRQELIFYMKQKNNHARSKQKRKKLRLKNLMKAIYERAMARRAKNFKPRGETFIATEKVRAKDIAILDRDNAKYDHGHVLRRNQRQRRKKWRQSPHMRRKMN